MDYAQILRKERRKLGLKQKEISKALGVPLATYKAWELGIRTPPDYVKEIIINKMKKG